MNMLKPLFLKSIDFQVAVLVSDPNAPKDSVDDSLLWKYSSSRMLEGRHWQIYKNSTNLSQEAYGQMLE